MLSSRMSKRIHDRAPLAYELGVGFVPVRKKGKLPYKCVDLTYKKEYECDTIEIHQDAIVKGRMF